jgi:hypothetical protein
MSSTAETILAALQTALAAANGTGSYNYDLSGTGRVQIGRPELLEPDPPRVWIEDWEFGINRQAEGYDAAPKGKDGVALDVTVLGYVAVSSSVSTVGGRKLAATALASDLHRALAANRQIGGALMVNLAVATLDGGALELGDYGVVLASLTFEYQSRAGL